MSDQSQGPGWWQASDGRWYPPDEPTIPQTVTERETIVSDTPQPVPPAGRWRTWQLVATGILALLVGFGLGSAGSSDDDDSLATGGGTTTSTTLGATTTTEDATTTTTEPLTTTTTAPPTTTTTAPPTTTTTSPPPTTAKPRAPQQVAEYRGQDRQSTAPFTIDPAAKMWKVAWDMKGDGNNAIQLYTPPDEYKELVANSIGPTASESTYYEAGTYYFKVTGSNWHITVTQFF